MNNIMDITEKIEKFLDEKDSGKHSKKCVDCGAPAEIHITHKGKKSSWCKNCYKELQKDVKDLPDMM